MFINIFLNIYIIPKYLFCEAICHLPPTMDIVYTYVDGSNEEWRAYYKKCGGFSPPDIRVNDHGELVFALELLKRHCPWIRNVYVVHAGSRVKQSTLESGLQLYPTNLHFIPQDTLMDGIETFCSCAVESRLHMIPGLSENFIYSNDDMFFGRPLHLSAFMHGSKPHIDFSLVQRPQLTKAPNLAQLHNDNAWNLFKSKFTRSPLPYMHVAHFGTVMSKSACEFTWKLYKADLWTNILANLFRTRETINFQLLASLVAVHCNYAHLRLRSYLPESIPRAPRQDHTRYARALVEMESEGLDYVLLEKPHHFCINGVEDSTEHAFTDFCTKYLSQCELLGYPPISRWFYAASK